MHSNLDVKLCCGVVFEKVCRKFCGKLQIDRKIQGHFIEQTCVSG